MGAARCDRRCARATSVSDGTGFRAVAVSKLRAQSPKRESSGLRNKQQRRRSPTPRSPAPAGVPLRRAPGAGSVLFDPEAGVVTGLTRDRDSRSENRCSMCSAIHISSRTSLRPSSTREPSDPPPRVVLSVAPNRAVAGIEFQARLGSAVKLSFRFARRIDPMGFAGGDPE